jgi:glycosyltransferase involved in cell wall biosynthesis
MLEAMSAGCLVIGSRTAPVEEVLRHEDDGLLVDFFKPEEIVAAITRVCGSRDRLQDLRSSARQTIIDRYASRPSACPSS